MKITEEIILKYAPSRIVYDFKESIKAYIDTNIQQYTWMMGERPNAEELKEIEENSKQQALDWLIRKHYTYYVDPETPERQQMQVNLEKLEIAYNLDKLAGEPVTEIEMINV